MPRIEVSLKDVLDLSNFIHKICPRGPNRVPLREHKSMKLRILPQVPWGHFSKEISFSSLRFSYSPQWRSSSRFPQSLSSSHSHMSDMHLPLPQSNHLGGHSFSTKYIWQSNVLYFTHMPVFNRSVEMELRFRSPPLPWTSSAETE